MPTGTHTYIELPERLCLQRKYAHKNSLPMVNTLTAQPFLNIYGKLKRKYTRNIMKNNEKNISIQQEIHTL